jgi:mannose-6-phosphate isomerase-like protein (cupin superfamily)
MDIPGRIDLSTTYVFLEDGGSAPSFDGGEPFWRDLMSGAPASSGAALVANGAGWLTAVYAVGRSTSHWERHPLGDELLLLLSGAIDVVLETREGERIMELKEGAACVVPRGTWHKQIVRVPGRELAITYGRGTQHRPL